LIKQIKICEIDEFIPNKQQKSFQELLRLLSNEFKIPVIRDTRLVRGLDYYNGTAFLKRKSLKKRLWKNYVNEVKLIVIQWIKKASDYPDLTKKHDKIG
jgi:hypothetical protein